MSSPNLLIRDSSPSPDADEAVLDHKRVAYRRAWGFLRPCNLVLMNTAISQLSWITDRSAWSDARATAASGPTTSDWAHKKPTIRSWRTAATSTKSRSGRAMAPWSIACFMPAIGLGKRRRYSPLRSNTDSCRQLPLAVASPNYLLRLGLSISRRIGPHLAICPDRKISHR